MRQLYILPFLFIFCFSTAQVPPECSIPTDELQANGSNDVKAVIQIDGSFASSFQSGENIEKSFDGDVQTLYHSNWNNTPFPVTLNYRLNGSTEVDYLKYIPRSDGGPNGNFGNVTIKYNTLSNNEFVTLMEYDFGESGIPQSVEFPHSITPRNVQLIVHNGFNNFVSCAEMEFYKEGTTSNPAPPTHIFANEICSELQPGVTQSQINAISSPFYRELAQCLFNESYDLRYRVSTHEVYTPLNIIHSELKVSGYDPFENPTGIALTSGDKIALFAKNIPTGAGVFLKIKNFEEGYYGTETYHPMKNGLNVFEIENTGLGYISYYNEDLSLPDVQINFVSGEVNGVFNYQTSTNADWVDLLSITPYPKLDIIGKYAHLVYDRDALLMGNPTDGLALINQYDLINQYERLLMGWYKYGISPKNHILSFSEYGGGYYAGGLGIHLDWTWGIPAMANPNQLDLWGIPHEFGHVNQIRPNLKWIGTTEVTNNIYSIWVYYMMNPEGRKYTRLEGDNGSPGPNMPAVTGGTINGAINNTYVNGKPLQDTDGYDVFKVLVPFWQLELYYQLAGASRNAPELTFEYPGDYTGIDYARWYGTVAEISRNTNPEGMTNGDFVMEFVKNTCDAVQEDLTEFFINTGFLKPIDVIIDDYGNGQLKITQQMIDQTIAYIQSKNYQQPVSPVMHYLSAFSMESFRDQVQLQGVPGEGVSLSGYNMTVQNDAWPGAVAFEVYDANNDLHNVAIVGSGDVSLQTTKVFFPSSGLAVYAVGYDGQKIRVYPAQLNVSDVSKGELKVYPNPVSSGERLHLQSDLDGKEFTGHLTGTEGRLLLELKGNLSEIEEQINFRLRSLKEGIYILNLRNEKGQTYSVKLIRK